jgi:predicted XRE-type DNA-binding protein
MSDSGAITIEEESARQRTDDLLNKAVNKQLYRHSPMLGSPVEMEYAESEEKLHGSQRPNFVVLHEKPEHRIALHLKARGYSNKEVAELMGYTQPWMSQIMRQPWAREYLTKLIAAAGKDAIQDLLKVEMANSVLALVEVRDDALSPAASRVSAANSLLDRFFGKPKVSVETTNTNVNTDASLAELNARYEALKQQEAQLFSIKSQVPING